MQLGNAMCIAVSVALVTNFGRSSYFADLETRGLTTDQIRQASGLLRKVLSIDILSIASQYAIAPRQGGSQLHQPDRRSVSDPRRWLTQRRHFRPGPQARAAAAVRQVPLGDWLQGINLAKVYGNSNLRSHCLELELNPQRTMQFPLNYIYLLADQLNNLGAKPVFSQLQSRDIGQELMLVTRWSATRNLFVLGVTSLAFPGNAIREAVSGPTQPWFTFQVSLFLGF